MIALGRRPGAEGIRKSREKAVKIAAAADEEDV
jgi:hypothetical protein